MIRDQLVRLIAASATPVTTATAAASAGLPISAENLAAVDLLLTLSPEVRGVSDGWVISVDTRDRRILNALRSYAEAHPEKKIFRVAAALAHLPPEDQMTEEQLRELVSQTGEFQFLANAMIKRGS